MDKGLLAGRRSHMYVQRDLGLLCLIFIPDDVTDYVLHDEEREQKFGMNLKTSLKRARKNGMTLFAGHSFYLTPGIPEVALTTLTNAIKSSGGTVRAFCEA